MPTSIRLHYVLLIFVSLFVTFFFYDRASAQVSENKSDTTTISNSENASTVPPYVTENIPGDGAIIGDFVVGPGKVDLTISPGQTKIVEMTVTNRTGERRRFNITTEDAEGSRNTEVPIVLLGDDRGPYSLKDYISVPHTNFELDHNTRAKIPVTITLPSNAEPGGRYGSVLIDTVAIEAVPGDTMGTAPQSAIVARVGTLFFITIPGAIERDGELSDFGTISKKKFFTEGPITFGILYENRGSMHLAPYGELRIHNFLGEEVGFVELEPWFVFPQSLRLREVAWGREYLFGRYTATIEVNRSYDDIVDTRSFVFWVLPWKPLIGVFAGFFVILFLIRTFFKTFEFKRKS